MGSLCSNSSETRRTASTTLMCVYCSRLYLPPLTVPPTPTDADLRFCKFHICFLLTIQEGKVSLMHKHKCFITCFFPSIPLA